ncbi:MAG: eL32 family ribosomal protein [Candidatus Woesearchaeota archaeon]
METKRLLELRNKQKKVKPKFVVRESKIYARMKSKWKFPYGTSSAIRQGKRGEPVLVSIGFGSPREVRGLHSSGLEKVVVSNKEQLLAVNTKTQGAVIASSVGNRNRIELLKLAVEKKIRVLNVKDISKLMEKIQLEFTARQKKRKDRLSEKNKKQEEKKKKAEEKKKKEEAEKTKEEKVDNKEESKDQQKEEKVLVEKELIKRQ